VVACWQRNSIDRNLLCTAAGPPPERSEAVMNCRASRALLRGACWTASLMLLAGVTIAEAEKPGQPAGHAFVFRDVGEETGLLPDVGGIRGHGAAWGDVTGIGWPDLFVAAFHNEGSKTGMLFRNDKGKFRLDGHEALRTSGNGSGALFVDLTNNGRLDLYVSNCAQAGKSEVRALPSRLFRNDGGGKFTDVSKESGACLPMYAGRGLAALDFDGDGLLDLVTCERYYGPVKVGPALFKNKGDHRFENVAEAAGLPAGLSGLGVAVADVNNDGWPDLFLRPATAATACCSTTVRADSSRRPAAGPSFSGRASVGKTPRRGSASPTSTATGCPTSLSAITPRRRGGRPSPFACT
jgi:hypothetical protein